MWSLYDERTGERATACAFLMRESAEGMILLLQDRQAEGKRPDADASHLVVREIPPNE